MAFLINGDQSIKLALPTKPQEKCTIGRIPQNSLQILDSTVSKNHAQIYYLTNEKKYVIEDLGSINGSYLNGALISGSKAYLKHNDQVQFGKNQEQYCLKLPHPEPEKKGKINFKDYNFELQDQLSPKPAIQVKKVQQPSTISMEGKGKTQPVNVQGKTQTGWNRVQKVREQSGEKINKQKFQRAIKIPKFEEFLELQGEQLEDLPQRGSKNVESDQELPVKKWQKPQQFAKKGTVKLPQLNKVQLSEEDKLSKMIVERKRQLQKAERQGLLKKAQEQQKMIEERLKLQLEKAEQEEQILKHKYEIQKRGEEQERSLQRQKALLVQRLRLQQEQGKQRQQLRRVQLKEKQESLLKEMAKVKEFQLLKLKEKQHQMFSQLHQEKQRQILQVKQTEQKKRVEKEHQIKREFEGRKRELELEAQALTRQYENIYKDTIKKLQLNIEAEQERSAELEGQIQKLDKDNDQIAQCLATEQEEQSILKQEFSDVAGRNKAFLLYASHLQAKIDHLKAELDRASIKDPSKTTLELKDSLLHSRRLLNLKLSQHQELTAQARETFLRLNISSPQSQSHLATILENFQETQRLKELYFEFLQEEKLIENKWDLELEENNLLEERMRNLKKQIQLNKKKLSQNLNDNLKKLTEQRLHMLKMMYYVPEDKKTAAKYLIEEMLNIDSENRAIILDSEQVHSKITELIISIEQKKRQNEHLSNIIFGNDSLTHHFDNMKAEINRLIACIENERDEYKVANLLKMSQEVKEVENKIYLEARREKKLKDEIKNTTYTIPPLNTEKNPLVFFGKVLTKKEAEIIAVSEQEKALEKKLAEIRIKVGALSDKKSKINKLLEDYKQKELRNIRDYLK